MTLTARLAGLLETAALFLPGRVDIGPGICPACGQVAQRHLYGLTRVGCSRACARGKKKEGKR